MTVMRTAHPPRPRGEGVARRGQLREGQQRQGQGTTQNASSSKRPLYMHSAAAEGQDWNQNQGYKQQLEAFPYVAAEQEAKLEPECRV